MTGPVRTAAIAALSFAVLCASTRGGAADSRADRGAGRLRGPVETARLCPRPPGDLPLDHWAYPLLDRLVARGFIRLDLSTLPLSRESVAEALAACLGRGAARIPEGATGREAWALTLLADEFLMGAVDRAIVALGDGGALLGLGIKLGSEMSYSSVDDRHDVSMDLGYELWGGAGENLGFYADTSVLLEGQDGPRAVKLSNRARTWRGIAVAADRAYLKYERPALDAAVGRRGVAWGRSRWGRLMLSGGAPTLDGVEARFRVGPLTLQALDALLERPTDAEGDSPVDECAGSNVFLAAHRAVLSGAWGSVGVAEAVVYSGDTPDPAYVNPLLPYYVSQHNERADDNVLWSLDFVARPAVGLELWGEFLIDDLQYERGTGHPDKYGLTVGVCHSGAFSRGDYELTCEYTNVRKWTYTHEVAGHSYTQDGVPLGFELGPDADRTTVEAAYHPLPPWTVTAVYSFTRRGEGSIEIPFEDGENDEPTFPSGDVVRTHGVSATLAYEDPRGVSAIVGASFARSRSELVDDDYYGFWARVGLRL